MIVEVGRGIGGAGELENKKKSIQIAALKEMDMVVVVAIGMAKVAKLESPSWSCVFSDDGHLVVPHKSGALLQASTVTALQSILSISNSIRLFLGTS